MSLVRQVVRCLVPSSWRPAAYLQNMVLRKTARQVHTGPFRGMHYVRESCSSAYHPKLLGTYEAVLHPVMAQIVAGDFDRLVDIGAAEGYYAIGLARSLPHAGIIAFDSNAKARALLQEMARLNGVADRVVIREKCRPADLAAALDGAGSALVICDCEGGEEELLRPDRVPGLRHAAVLVEMHEFLSRGITERVRRAFDHSHMIEEIWERESPPEFPLPTLYTRIMPREYLLRMLSEERPERMNWLWMTPKPPDRGSLPTPS